MLIGLFTFYHSPSHVHADHCGRKQKAPIWQLNLWEYNNLHSPNLKSYVVFDPPASQPKATG
jgi:hypothetical protein